MINIRLPNINGTTDRAQLEQIKRYLYQIAEELNYAVTNMGDSQNKVLEQIKQVSEGSGKTLTPESINEQFNALKPLIIKSAEIVNAYYEKISTELEGNFVAKSDFGTYQEDTRAELTATSENITQSYTLIEEIKEQQNGIEEWRRNTEAYIRTGWLNSDAASETPVYGVEIGQKTIVNDETVFKKSVRCTPEKITFFDGYGNELGSLSSKTLYINNIVVQGVIYLGDIKFDTSQGGVAIKWARGEELNGSK